VPYTHVFATHETGTAKVGYSGEDETIVYGNKGKGWRFLGMNDKGQYKFDPGDEN
jgi:hypothetical protein